MTDKLNKMLAHHRLLESLIVPYGSRVYGTHTDKSDYDYLVITDNAITGVEIHYDDIDLQTFTPSDFQQQLNSHKIHTLEAYFSNEQVEKKFKFVLDKVILRNELSQKASHSFVKAKKKIEVEKDFYVGWKSLFHSLRILHFGIQLGIEGRIIDYSAANHHWSDILNSQQYNWGFFKEKYQPIYNQLATDFRKVAPKD